MQQCLFLVFGVCPGHSRHLEDEHAQAMRTVYMHVCACMHVILLYYFTVWMKW